MKKQWLTQQHILVVLSVTIIIGLLLAINFIVNFQFRYLNKQLVAHAVGQAVAKPTPASIKTEQPTPEIARDAEDAARLSKKFSKVQPSNTGVVIVDEFTFQRCQKEAQERAVKSTEGTTKVEPVQK